MDELETFMQWAIRNYKNDRSSYGMCVYWLMHETHVQPHHEFEQVKAMAKANNADEAVLWSLEDLFTIWTFRRYE